MLQLVETLETKLDDLFRKKMPFQLPEQSRRSIVEYMPWINLLLGILTLFTAFSLWRWSHATQASIDYLNRLSADLGGKTVTANRLSMTVWAGLAVLFIEGCLFLAAYTATKERKKRGWNLLFYAALVNIAYGIVITLSAYDGGGRLITSLFMSAIGLYFLFQIRGFYTGRRPHKLAKDSDEI